MVVRWLCVRGKVSENQPRPSGFSRTVRARRFHLDDAAVPDDEPVGLADDPAEGVGPAVVAADEPPVSDVIDGCARLHLEPVGIVRHLPQIVLDLAIRPVPSARSASARASAARAVSRSSSCATPRAIASEPATRRPSTSHALAFAGMVRPTLVLSQALAGGSTTAAATRNRKPPSRSVTRTPRDVRARTTPTSHPAAVPATSRALDGAGAGVARSSG
jgi:hypothetical protein